MARQEVKGGDLSAALCAPLHPLAQPKRSEGVSIPRRGMLRMYRPGCLATQFFRTKYLTAAERLGMLWAWDGSCWFGAAQRAEQWALPR